MSYKKGLNNTLPVTPLLMRLVICNYGSGIYCRLLQVDIQQTIKWNEMFISFVWRSLRRNPDLRAFRFGGRTLASIFPREQSEKRFLQRQSFHQHIL